MMVSKVINFSTVQTVITEVHHVTIGPAIVFLKISTIPMLSAHFFAWIMSMTHVAMVPTMFFRGSQYIGLTMPSTASRWDVILMASSCVLSSTSCILYSTVSYVLESFKTCLGTEILATLDDMALKFDVSCLQTIRQDFPRTDFARGVTNLTLIECSEQSGTLFLFAALTMQVEVWHAMSRYIPDLPAVLGTMECLLCFEAWLEADTY
jgi:hypothetical protein